MQHSAAVINQLIVPPTNLPEDATGVARRAAVAGRVRRAVFPMKVNLSPDVLKAWRIRSQRDFAAAVRTPQLKKAQAVADKADAKVPRVHMRAVFDSYEKRRQRNQNKLYQNFRTVRTQVRRKGGNH